MLLKSVKELQLFHSQAIKSGLQSSIFTFNNLIHCYAKHGFLRYAHKLFDEMPERNVFTWNTIIAAHLKNQDIKTAELLFKSSPYKDLVTYNSMLSGYVNADDKPEHESSDQALRLFVEMQSSQVNGGSGRNIDEFTITTMLNLVAKLSFASLGMQLHSYMVKSGNDHSGFSCSSLIDMYSKCGCFQEAIRVFNDCRGGLDSVSKNAIVAACCRENKLDLALDIFWHEAELNDTISWNTIISGFVQNDLHEKALRLFICMMENGIRLNNHTFASILGACSGTRSLNLGKEVHAHVLKAGFIENSFISSGIVDVYCKCGNMDYAKSAYTAFSMGNAFSITSMIVGYSSIGNMVEARRLFDTLREKNSIVWTALFSGYVKSHCCEAALELLSEFLAKEVNIPDVLILMTLLGACAIQASLHPGKQIHSYILRIGMKLDNKLQSSMIDMYSKCGHITSAERIFSGVKEKDSVLYNVMIAGYANHGQESEAIKLFKEMCERNIRPNAATFVALLSTCRHAGLVESGEKHFDAMERDYGIQREVDHYACMIDLYGRAHKLDKAAALMEEIPFEPDAVLLGAFLNACRISGNLNLARETEEKLLRIEGENGSRYVQLANVYASEGDWDEVGRIRKKMKGKVIKKLVGCSWIHLEKGVTVFTSGDTSHLKSDAIYSLLACLVAEINHLALVKDLLVDKMN
ncbi:putative pentatricopeptide repeat-containing protein At3g18840 [Chenopodium quinoa]|uniref:putative pentatricopeptide repeat-containing protein At3g18840 n=1 Tax=Chenopodium quinoa TaxID=63459 RepID=UPI000B782865|nr:putative pentatricopeptide repeat-containing protein At3g18840 [Chenopodium quinoa]XP_021728868.1 putative pentatricopeptide repeat-containing protein At3g18840 [Chenopodium quinoa]